MVSNPLAILWTGRCTVWEHESVTDPVTHQTTQHEVAILTDEPCRISFLTEAVTNIATGVAEMQQ